MMNDKKPWYKSKSIWGGAASVLAGAAMFAGIDVDQGQLTEQLMQAAATIGGIIAVAGRVVAKDIIG